MVNDPYILPPVLWFGLLCHGVTADPAGRPTFQGVFNQVAYLEPPADTGIPPHGALAGLLAVGFSNGLGHFMADIEIRDAGDALLWARQKPWAFDVGPGLPSAVLVEMLRYWLRMPGLYRIVVRLPVLDRTYEIPFEVARVIGPASVAPPQAPEAE